MAQKKMTKFGRIMFDHNQEDNNYRVHQECVPEHLTWRRVFITSRGGEISRSKCANQMANIEAHNQTPLSHYLSNFGISNQHCQQGQIKHRKLYTNLHIDNKSIISERIQAKPSNKTPASGAYRHLLAAVGFLSIVVAGLASGQQLPTVIVRGFLNYRTTVDGTVLLFTPDAGGQQTQQSAAIQATSSSQLIQPTLTASVLFANHHDQIQSKSEQSQVEPTSVLNDFSVSSRTASAADQMQSSAVPVAHPDINEPERANDEWRPIQATPPLKLLSASVAQNQNLVGQGDDEQNAPSSTTPRPKRPQFGSNQASRSRQTNRARANDGTPTSINGIRRPGLTGQQSQLQQQADLVTPEAQDSAASNAANANFQSRLASANARMRNRLKHKQPIPAAPASVPTSPPSSPPSSSPPPPITSIELSPNRHDPSGGSSTVASLPDGGLDVAASSPVEQPPGEHNEPIERRQGAPQAALTPSASLPVVGSDEVLLTGADSEKSTANNPIASSSPTSVESDLTLEPISAEQEAGLKALSRAGELRPSALHRNHHHHHGNNEEQPQAKLPSGELQQGALSSGSMSFDALFQSDQPVAETRPHEHPVLSSSRPGGKLKQPLHHHTNSQHQGSNNEKLNGWLGQHHNKFVARPATKPHDQPGHLSHQLAANLNQLAPSSTTMPPLVTLSASLSSPANRSSSLASNSTGLESAIAAGSYVNANQTMSNEESSNQTDLSLVSMQTITRTYSTVLQTSKTRIVPLQVKSSTGVYTITEDYVMTKMMTAYQTMPAGEFIVPELSSRSPFEVFGAGDQQKSPSELQPSQQVHAAPAAPAISSAPIETQEQPISLDTSPKGANNWLHDFTNPTDVGNQMLGDPFQQSSQQQQQQQQQQNMLALLEQQAREANLANFPTGSSDLEQLASQLDASSLLADGAINIPDLNNPLVLAAAIQNPQLAAVILAAQQLRLKQRANGNLNGNNNKLATNQQQQQAMQQALAQLQPSYSTSFSTTVRPSTYTARDTMYTTRLVSFRDGRTVRSRTVSEPGSVIEQVLTTTITETIPITVTIKPTGVLALPTSLATAPPINQLGANSNNNNNQLLSNQATINNALIATQLANILARRQQQLQTSFATNPALNGLGALGQAGNNGAATPQQLLALQQLFGGQKRQQQQQQQQQQQSIASQFQPNLQQLLQSMQAPSSAVNSTSQSNPAQAGGATDSDQPAQISPGQQLQTPALAQVPRSIVSSPTNPLSLGPITTTLTSLQVRTYTVHNAFKTIFRTITSTILIPTVLPTG